MMRKLTAALSISMFVLNTLFVSAPIYLLALLRALLPVAGWRRLCDGGMARLGELWIDVNRVNMALTQRITWDIQLPEGLSPQSSYLVISNHRSMIDIPALQSVLNHKIPFLKFFLKHSLIYVPVLGGVWWSLGFPFMRRYTKEQRERDPRIKGSDLDRTKQACAKFRGRPTTILNYLEGTRWTEKKHREKESVYRNLLPPKAGGIAGVIAEMGEHLAGVLDVTVWYEPRRPVRQVELMDLFSGNLRRVIVRARLLQIPQDLLGGDYEGDPEFRKRFQDWVNGIWSEKDELLDALQ